MTGHDQELRCFWAILSAERNRRIQTLHQMLKKSTETTYEPYLFLSPAIIFCSRFDKYLNIGLCWFIWLMSTTAKIRLSDDGAVGGIRFQETKFYSNQLMILQISQVDMRFNHSVTRGVTIGSVPLETWTRQPLPFNNMVLSVKLVL